MNTQRGFVAAFKDYWFRAGDFHGSSRRGQYWWIIFMNVLAALAGIGITIATILAVGVKNEIRPGMPLAVFGGTVGVIFVVLFIWYLYQGLPQLTVTIRRYRDAGVSPWALLVTRLAPTVIMFIAPSQSLAQLLSGILLLADLVITLLPTRHPVPLWATQPNEGSQHVGIRGAFVDFFHRGGVFSGRSSRSQYWWIVLLSIILGIATTLALAPTLLFSFISTTGSASSSSSAGMAPSLLFQVVRFYGILLSATSILNLPQLTITIRRFRDASISPWWYGALWAMQSVVALVVALNEKLAFAWIVYFILFIVEIIILALPTKHKKYV